MPRKLTIFSIPMPSADGIRPATKNAIASWQRLRPSCEIILFGGDEDIGVFARNAGIQNIPDVARSRLGTPLLSDVFARAQQIASGEVLMFSNCDMLYFDDLQDAIEAVHFKEYMLCGRRWDVDVSGEVDLRDDSAWEAVRNLYGRSGRMHGPSGLDFFIFPRDLHIEMLPLVVGRPGWDSWFMWHLRSRRIPVIDATGSIAALHQNHGYAHLKYGAAQYTGEEMVLNHRLAGGYKNMLGLREADWILEHGRVARPGWPRRIFSLMGPWLPYRYALALKRSLQGFWAVKAQAKHS
jgi:hypothetical protein